MKSILIAAGMAALLLGAAPASAAPITPQERSAVTGGDGQRYRDDARAELKGKRFWERKRAESLRTRAVAKRSCRTVRGHHRRVRVCRR